jgi:hypothetical protein
VLPPLLAIGALTALPWAYKYDLAIGQPAGDIGRFFSESFQRRTGKPLAIVTGDEHTAALVALAAPSRPSVYFDTKPERSPWVSRQDIESKGAVVVWPTTDTTGAPPAEIKARFPELIPDVPRSFSRTVQGRLPLMRIGWGVIRPRGSASEAPPQVQPSIQVQPQTQPRVQPQAQPLVQPQSQPLAQPKLEPPPQQKTPPRPQQQRRPQPQQRFRDPGTQW